MALVLDLKKKTEETKPEIPKPEPVVQHPVVKEQKVLTDTGNKLPYQTLRWAAPSAYRREGIKSPYVVSVVLAIIAVLAAVFQGDITTVILFGLLSVMVVVHVRKSVPIIRIEVTPLSIKAGDHTYAYDQIESFWIQYEPEFDIRELSLHLKKWYMPYTKIQIGEEDPVQIRAILLQFIPEAEHKENLAYLFARRLGL